MDNSLITPYSNALSAQKAQLENYLSSGFKTIAVPAHISQIESSQLHMLGKSAVAFLIIGAVGLIYGLIAGSMGIIIAGCAGLLSGGYLWVKGKQASRSDAFTTLGKKIYAEIQVIADKISSEWNSFITVQNDNLKKQIVGSDASVDSKVSLIDRVEKSPAVHIDLDAVSNELKQLDTTESLEGYTDYLAKAQAAIKTAIDNADGAQQTIYNTMMTEKQA